MGDGARRFALPRRRHWWRNESRESRESSWEGVKRQKARICKFSPSGVVVRGEIVSFLDGEF
jgi:hypothetical protein